MDNSLKKNGQKRQNQTLPYRQRTENKRLTANRGEALKRIAPQNQNQNPRIAYAKGRVKPLARLLRCATALRVTAPHGCGSRRLVCPKGSLSARPHVPKPPETPRDRIL